MKDLAPTPPEDAPRRRWVGRGLLLLALAVTAWFGWREYDHRAAIREAEAAGFVWEVREPIALIRADWRAAFQKATWTESYSYLDVGEGRDLARLRPLLLRLRPTTLIAAHCQNANLDALQGLFRLRLLDLSDCPALQNVDALQGLFRLQVLRLDGCAGLEHTGALAALHQLEWLSLTGCTGIHGAEALQGLAGLGQLKVLRLNGCTGLERGAVLEKMKELGLKCYIEGP